MADPPGGEQRCHGACNVGRQPTLKEAQAWEIAGRPQTHCEVSRHLPPSRSATSFSVLERLEYVQSHIPTLLFSANGLLETVIILDEKARARYRQQATPWEVRFSRILNLSVAPVNGTGALATPIVDDASVLAYVDKEFEGFSGGGWIWIFRDVTGNEFYRKIQTTPKMDLIVSDDNMNELLAIVVTLGTSLVFRAVVRGVISSAVSILGREALAAGASDLAGAAAVSAEANEAAHLAFMARRARAAVELLRKEGEEVILNAGGEFSAEEVRQFGPFQITLGLPRQGAPKYIPFLIREDIENIGTIFKPGDLDRIVSKDLTASFDVDRFAQGAFKALGPGKRLKMQFHVIGEDADTFTRRFMNSLTKAGFKDVKAPLTNPATGKLVPVVEATR